MPDVVNIAIVDDEKIQVELLEKYVSSWASEKKVRVFIEKFYNTESFEFSWSMNKKYDVLLLDIQMPEQNGVELAKKIRKEDSMISIIFITAVSDFIQEGYEVAAINYLIKPVEEQKLDECLSRAADKIQNEEKTIIIEVDGAFNRIKQKDILYIEAFAHSIDINIINRKYTVRKSISEIEKELDGKSFIRCHRSYIAGLRYIKKIENNELELDNGSVLPISRRQYANTNVAFIRYFKGDSNEQF